jgi:predicted nucleic acid-binding protein
LRNGHLGRHPGLTFGPRLYQTSASNDSMKVNGQPFFLAEAQSSPVLLLIDDADGRAEAERRNIAATGTLGVLRAAGLRSLTNLPLALTRLRATNFRCPAGIIDELIAEDAQRKGAKQ